MKVEQLGGQTWDFESASELRETEVDFQKYSQLPFAEFFLFDSQIR